MTDSKPARSKRTEPSAPRAELVTARTCVACRAQAERDQLMRLVEGPDGATAVDPRARASGRGAWVHASRECLVMAAKRHAAERSLKIAVRDVDAADLVAGVVAALTRKAHSLVLAGSRKHSVAMGTHATIEALETGRVPLVTVARDAAEARKAIGPLVEGDRAAASGVSVRVFGTKSELGRLFGRGEVAVFAVTDPRIAAELMWTIDRLAGLEG